MNNAAYLPGFIILAVVVAVNPRGVSRGATADQDWVAYEGIQADIFDHLLAVGSRSARLSPQRADVLDRPKPVFPCFLPWSSRRRCQCWSR